MSNARLRPILAFALIIMLLLTSCQQAVTYPGPQEPELPVPNETVAASAQPEPEEPEPEPTEPPTPTYEIYRFGGYDWRVLDVQEDGRMFLLSQYVIDHSAFHDRHWIPTWETSSLRHWLNTEFYESFSEVDRARIVLTEVETPDNLRSNGSPGGNDTEDFIFLLSFEEVVEYLHVQRLASAPHVRYGRDLLATDVDGREARWWLRSPGIFNRRVSVRLGSLSPDGEHISSRDELGVRPALWLEPEDAPYLPPVQVWQPYYRIIRGPARTWEPWETQEMQWPELFATFVGRLADEAFREDLLADDERTFLHHQLIHPRWFAIMDMNYNGEPQLVLGSTSWYVSGGFYVFTIDDAKQFLHSDSVDAFLATWQLSVIGEEPLRFFQNDDTGAIIFSSLHFSFGDRPARVMSYTAVNTLGTYSVIICFGEVRYINWPSLQDRGIYPHEHRLWRPSSDEPKTLPGLEMPDAVFEYQGIWWDWQYWSCDIDLGRNSSDPSVVTLVDMVLEGFTEISPQRFMFPERFGWTGGEERSFGADDVRGVQDWIFEVAAQWGEVDPAA